MQNKTVEKIWNKQYINYFREANPFDEKNKARIAEWEAIYNAFNINTRCYPKLLDFGCGNGHFALNFLKKGFDVTGMDVSIEALRIVEKRMRKYMTSKKLHMVHNGLYKPLKNLEGKFDAGCMIVTYQFVSNKKEEQDEVLKNFIKLIKRGGKILIMENNPLNPLFYFYYAFFNKNNSRQGFNTINSRKERLVSLLRKLGMGNIEIYYHSFLPTSYINRWSFVKNINIFLCSIPGIRNFAAFNIITAVKKKSVEY